MLEKVAAQAQNVADATEEKGPFTEPLKKFPASISATEHQRIRDEVLKVVKEEVNPAFAKFAVFVKNDYAPKGRTDMGVWSLPNGDAYYQHQVKLLIATGYTPEQIHQMGLKQVAELDGQMLAIAKSQGYPDVKSFNEHIRKDPELHGTSGQQSSTSTSTTPTRCTPSCRNSSGSSTTPNWSSCLWRPSAHLVVDTGVHYKHWTREQMVQFFRDHTAMDEPNIQTEVDRYIAWPGQALSYKMGQMEILALREQAKKELGAKYDIKTFHDELLSAGPLPLDVLHQRMTAWISKQK